MVFAHRLECDQTDDGGFSVLVPSVLWKLPLLAVTALVKHGIVAISSSSSSGYHDPAFLADQSYSPTRRGGGDAGGGGGGWFGGSGRNDDENDGGGGCSTYLPLGPGQRRSRGGSFQSINGMRWEPNLPTIDEDPNQRDLATERRQQQRQYPPTTTVRVGLHGDRGRRDAATNRGSRCRSSSHESNRGDDYYDDDDVDDHREEPAAVDASTALVTLAVWLPAVLWGVNFLWFSIEQTNRAVALGNSSSWWGVPR